MTEHGTPLDVRDAAGQDLEQRHHVETAKWDAHARSASLETIEPDTTTFEALTTDRLLYRGMAAFLGPLEDRQVLEYGCGLGKLTVALARSGARVTSFDLSASSVEAARQRIAVNGLEDRVEFVVASGEALPFEDGRFDVAVGTAILHHLDPVLGASELARVLRPGGRAAFSEPMGRNPVLNFVRAYVPYPAKHERGADRPLTAADVAAWSAPFTEFAIDEVQLLSMVERAFGFQRSFRTLRRMDDILLARLPFLRRFCRYAVLTFVR